MSKDLQASTDSQRNDLKWTKSEQENVSFEAVDEHSQKFSPSSKRSFARAEIASAGVALSLVFSHFVGFLTTAFTIPLLSILSRRVRIGIRSRIITMIGSLRKIK